MKSLEETLEEMRETCIDTVCLKKVALTELRKVIKEIEKAPVPKYGADGWIRKKDVLARLKKEQP